jgi:uncharacterized membrane protein
MTTLTSSTIETPAVQNPAVQASVAKALNQTDSDRTAGASSLRIRDHVASGTGLAATLFSGAIFGFFFAYVCSAMYGLDATDPRVAIEAMRAINAAVRNPVFFPAFFLTPLVLLIAATSAAMSGARRSATAFALAAVVYIVGGIVPTMLYNIPMNEDLAALTIPTSVSEAQVIWDDYSPRWQYWNLVRTVFAGISLGLAGLGLLNLRSGRR